MTLDPDDAEVTEVVPTPDEIAALLQVEHLLDQRWPETKIEPSLARIAALMDLLGSPQRSYPSIHIAGTNGKTSVARMVDALLTALQRRTGRTTGRRSLGPYWAGGEPRLIEMAEPVGEDHLVRPGHRRWRGYATNRPWRRELPMTSVSAFDVLLVVVEFIALFAATWIAWFVLISLYQILTRRTKVPTVEASGIRSRST